jgi:hypothetical protein
MTPVSDRSVLRGKRHQQKWRADRERRTQIRHRSPSAQSRFDGEKFKKPRKKEKSSAASRGAFFGGAAIGA